MPLLLASLLFLSAGRPCDVLAARGEQAIGFSLGAGLVNREPKGPAGPSAEVSWWLGANDWLWLAASLGSTAFLGSTDRHPRILVEGMGGVVVAADLVRIVPHAEALMGLAGAPAEPTVRLGAGVDYFISRSWALGAVLRYRPLPEGSWLSLGLRLSLRLDG